MRFAPGCKLSATVALLLPLLLGLGSWQLQRAAEKRAILDTIDARRSAPPLALDELLAAAVPPPGRGELQDTPRQVAALIEQEHANLRDVGASRDI